MSIEVCHPDETGQFTAASMSSLVRLTAWLCEAFGLDPETGVIRHYDVTGKECPLYYVEHPEAWDAFRADVALAMEEDRPVTKRRRKGALPAGNAPLFFLSARGARSQ